MIMIVFRIDCSNAFYAVALLAAVVSSAANAAVNDNKCVKTINVLENMFDAEKLQFKNDHCALLKAAAANRGAMIHEINADPEECGLDPKVVAAIFTQYQQFGQQATACR
ncbi:hypothetical protein [Rhizobium sp. BK376]|uniref:hypothetical protein n=1 Tax=Rhizobium sp. BK376 TaxID=2512149 RepID=UPI0010456640|nr:hypothetical protein [Rhizobium sp. BK376]